MTARTSSIEVTLKLASQGPTLLIVSNDAARMVVSILSKLDGIITSPLVLPDLFVMSTLILPILPVFCNSRKSRLSLSRPSVCPNIAPTTSGFSTKPFALI